ncbi:MAG: ParB/RepB/Spo0J family partition protein [Candidatus Brocadiales bacterium]
MLGRGKLGKSLESLLRNVVEVEPSSSTPQISPESVQPNPHRPRREFSPQAIRSLVDSISKRGTLQPILVRPAKDGRPCDEDNATSSFYYHDNSDNTGDTPNVAYVNGNFSLNGNPYVKSRSFIHSNR